MNEMNDDVLEFQKYALNLGDIGENRWDRVNHMEIKLLKKRGFLVTIDLNGHKFEWVDSNLRDIVDMIEWALE